MAPVIRRLDRNLDLNRIATFYTEAADYWILADRIAPDRNKAQRFFTDCPPNCDPALSEHLGMFDAERLIGLSELSFGFPERGDAYLGLQLLAPDMRGKGLGRILFADVERRARLSKAPAIYLAVLKENPRGQAFWNSLGFVETGLSGEDHATGHVLFRLVKNLS